MQLCLTIDLLASNSPLPYDPTHEVAALLVFVKWFDLIFSLKLFHFIFSDLLCLVYPMMIHAQLEHPGLTKLQKMVPTFKL